MSSSSVRVNQYYSTLMPSTERAGDSVQGNCSMVLSIRTPKIGLPSTLQLQASSKRRFKIRGKNRVYSALYIVHVTHDKHYHV